MSFAFAFAFGFEFGFFTVPVGILAPATGARQPQKHPKTPAGFRHKTVTIIYLCFGAG
jgi:hypothetical protein